MIWGSPDLGSGVTQYLLACWSVDAGKQQTTHVITRERLNLFADQHPDAKSALANWYRLAKQHDFASFAELRSYFPAADQVGKLTVFNIGGNKVRLVAAVYYNRQKIYIRGVLTHADFDTGKWLE